MMILINPAGTQNTGLYSVRAKHVNEYEQASHALIKLHDRYSVQLLLLQSEVRTEVLPYFYCTKVLYLRTFVLPQTASFTHHTKVIVYNLYISLVPSYYFYVLPTTRKYGSTEVLSKVLSYQLVLSYFRTLESTKVLRKYVQCIFSRVFSHECTFFRWFFFELHLYVADYLKKVFHQEINYESTESTLARVQLTLPYPKP